MISWIQYQLQRHFRFVFVVLLAVIIVAFVFTIGAAPGIGGGERGTLARTFYGVNLGSQEETERLFNDANLSVYLQAGFPALQGAQLQQYALQRHAGLHLAQQMNLPPPTREQLTEYVRELRAFAGQDGQFDPQAYSRFRDMIRTSPGGNEATLVRVLNDDYRYDRVQKLLGGPGYVLDTDVLQQIARGDTTWQVNVATVDYTSFQPNIQPTEAELQAYFESNAFRYERPAQVRVAYVDFPASEYVDQVNLTDAEVRAFYDSNPGRFPNPARAEQAEPAVDIDADPEADFAAVRPQVEAALRLERARQLAAQAASDLTVDLFEAGATAETAEQLVTAEGRTLRAAPAFEQGAAPDFLGNNPQHAAAAFRLSADRPISDALPTPQGAVVMVWQESVPSRPAEFAEVQAQVREDYIENQRRQQFAALGRELREEIGARVQRGETFEAAATAEAQEHNVTLNTQSFGPFPRREPPQDLSRSALSALERLEEGEISELIVTGDEGLLVHAASRAQPEITAEHPRFQEVRTQMAQSIAAQTAEDILADMVRRELERTELPAS